MCRKTGINFLVKAKFLRPQVPFKRRHFGSLVCLSIRLLGPHIFSRNTVRSVVMRRVLGQQFYDLPTSFKKRSAVSMKTKNFRRSNISCSHEKKSVIAYGQLRKMTARWVGAARELLRDTVHISACQLILHHVVSGLHLKTTGNN